MGNFFASNQSNELDDFLNKHSSIIPCFNYYLYDPDKNRIETENEIIWTVQNEWGGEKLRTVSYHKSNKLYTFQLLIDNNHYSNVETYDYKQVLIKLFDVDPVLL